MRVGFTGTREGMTDVQHHAVLRVLCDLRPTEAHHGDCMGADEQFHQLFYYSASVADVSVIIHPPEDESFRAFCDGNGQRPPKPYLDRNRDIVDETDVLIAAPKQTVEPAKRRAGGTWFTVRYARQLGRKIYIR